MSNKQKKLLRRIITAAVLLVLLGLGKNLLPFGEPARTAVLFALYLIPYYIIGHDILAKAWRGVRNGRVLDECFLMAIATVGAFAIALLEQSGEFAEAVAVMLFFQTGELFESGNAEDLKKKIERLWGDKKLCEAYSKNCKDISFDTIDEYYEKIMKVYR